MGSSSPDTSPEISGSKSLASVDLVNTSSPKITRERFLQRAGAVVSGLALGLGITSGVNAQEVPPPAPGEINEPPKMGDDESRELALISEPEKPAVGEVTASIEAYPTTFPKEFGDLKKDKLLIKNYGTKSGLAPGDPELYNNILWARDNYADHPEIKRTIVTYDSIQQMEAAGVPFDHAHAVAWPWDAWGREVAMVDRTRQKFPPTFTDGQIRWFVSPDGSRMEFHITMPEARPGVTPHWSQLQTLSYPAADERFPLFRILFSNQEEFIGNNYVNYSNLASSLEEIDPQYQKIRLAPPVDEYRKFKLPLYIVSK